MPSANGRFAVHCSGVVADSLVEFQEQAASSALKNRIAAAFRNVVRKLQRDPRNVGEALYRLPVMRMDVRTTVVAPLAIIFAVCDDHPLVFIKAVSLLETSHDPGLS